MANNTNWLNISSQSGSSGQTILTLSANKNLSTNYKTAEITAYNPVYNVSAKTYVTIEAYSAYIEISPTIIPVADSGGTFELNISANCSWVIAYPDLVSSYSTTAGTGNRTITFSVPSTTADTTLVGNIVVTDESGQVSRTTRIEQYGAGAHISIFPVELYFDSTGGSKTFSVTADCAYNVSMGSGGTWASVTPNSGYTGQTTFTVTVDSGYTGDTQRSTAVLIDAPGISGLVAVYQKKPETRLIVGYYVTSTTEPTVIMNTSGLSGVSLAEYPDGTQITPDTAYTFPATGMQYVYYTLTGDTVPQSMFDAFGYSGLSETVKTVIIPDGITGVGQDAFYGLLGLTSVTLPDTLEVLSSRCFYYCAFSSITLPDSLSSIGTSCFGNCSSLSSITIPSGVTSIGQSCFAVSSVSSITFTSLTPPVLANTDSLTSNTLSEIIVPCPAVNDYITAWPQYAQYISCSETGTTLYFVTDTSNVKGVGETRTITILNTNINPNRTGLNLPSDFPQQGSYTVVGNTIYLTYPANPSSSATRNWTIGVVAQTNDGVNLSGSYTITQNANAVYSIPYTADTSTVSESGETRIITIDASNLVASSITIGVAGATGVSATYSNGVVTVVFPLNTGTSRIITITVTGETTDLSVGKAEIEYIQDGETPPTPDTHLTFYIISNGNIKWTYWDSSTASKTIEYSKDNGSTWTSITSTSAAPEATIAVVAGDKVLFRGDNNEYGNNTFRNSTCGFIVSGNMMSLINSTGFSGETVLTETGEFNRFFQNCTGLTSAENLILPATALTTGCYTEMFYGCTSLTTAPALPATTLATGCYGSMFAGCTSLTTGPALSATTLAERCYYNMFSGCTSLTTAPELPATALTSECYCVMFSGCTSLTTAPTLPATALTNYCYQQMFDGCTSLTTAPALPATTLSGSCYSSMFNGCTLLTTAPELPATALTTSCYNGMFSNCTSLTTAPSLPATTLATGCYSSMFQGCTSLTTAPELPAATLTQQCYYNMFYGCTNLNYIKCLATNKSASYCTYRWVNGVQTSSGTFVTPSSTNWSTGNDGIPSGWTRVNA